MSSQGNCSCRRLPSFALHTHDRVRVSRSLVVEYTLAKCETVMDVSILLTSVHDAPWTHPWQSRIGTRVDSTVKNRRSRPRACMCSRVLEILRQEQLPCEGLKCKTRRYTWRRPIGPKDVLYLYNKEGKGGGARCMKAERVYQKADTQYKRALQCGAQCILRYLSTVTYQGGSRELCKTRIRIGTGFIRSRLQPRRSQSLGTL
jgi:hypothetical protein